MKIFLIIFLFFSFNAFGEWMKLAKTKDDLAIFYADFDTKTITNNYIMIWELVSYPKKLHPDYDIYSAKNYIKIDCNNKRFKMLNSYYYSGLKGNGELLEVETTETGWHYWQPGGARQTFYLLICVSD